MVSSSATDMASRLLSMFRVYTLTSSSSSRLVYKTILSFGESVKYEVRAVKLGRCAVVRAGLHCSLHSFSLCYPVLFVVLLLVLQLL